ncbi:SHOCT domain-containing protein [Desulfosporosinus sp. PR]|uniref:SHOCT domain-containing protein n=1 Tax=Candidatus Desulfosporosinus nitrosoreducens TaxID=3401928 RepID=UPI0027E6C53D|nr:SHOCT domain-containing protein [Desulfosporosinus sp. PR]MDQ7093125.1 SHOCT domain-containing protein [Desulfosporosinus sp. PR]
MMGGWGHMIGGWGNGYGYGYGMSMMGFIMPLIFGVGIVLLAIYAFRRSGSRLQAGEFSHRNAAMDILRERYARGEIDTAEYQSRKQDLEGR